MGFRYLVVILVSIFLILNGYFASADFVCGQVKNGQGIDASWVNVRINYAENLKSFSYCKVSPDDFKYCCDPLGIKDVNWAIGKEITSQISEEGGLYFALPVRLNTSGAAFDVFPDLYFKKAVNINSPEYSVFNVSSLNFNVSLSSPFNSLSYSLSNYSGEINQEICSGCDSALFNLNNLTAGKYSIKLIASNGSGEVNLIKNFTIVNWINFNRSFYCKGCKGDVVPRGAMVNVSLKVDLPYAAEGKLIEYYPNSWFYSGEGERGHYSSTHDYVAWQVNGNHIEQNYTLIAPNSFFSKKYYFQSKLDSLNSERQKIMVKGSLLFSLTPFSSGFNLNEAKRFYSISYLESSAESPLILYLNDSEISQIALFPKNTTRGAYSFIQKSSPITLSGGRGYLTVVTNLQGIQKVEIYGKIKKSSLKNKRAAFYFLDLHGKKWIELSSEKINEDEVYLYYKAHSNKTGTFTLKYVKDK